MRLLLVALALAVVQSPGPTPAATTDRPKPQATAPQANTPRESESKTSDGWNLGLTIAIAGAAVVQVLVSIWQARVYERQHQTMIDTLVASNKSAEASNKSAEAALQSAAAFEKLERPFLMIETRSHNDDEPNTQVWAVNKGRVPAQIVWWNNVPRTAWPKWDEEMRADFDYGSGFYNPDIQVINVEWIAPEGDKYLATFDPNLYKQELAADLQKELNEGRRIFYYLSGVKYRGMLSDKVFESRWCFSYSKARGLYLNGPYGYNSYT